MAHEPCTQIDWGAFPTCAIMQGCLCYVHHQTLTKDHKQWPRLQREHQSISQMLVSFYVLEIQPFWKNEELILTDTGVQSQESTLVQLREKGVKLSSR